MTNLYSISYNVNNATGGNTPPIQTAESNASAYTFVTPTAREYGLFKTDYGFLGWANNQNAISPDYQAGSIIELTSTNPAKTLYAVWGNPTLSNIINMQQMSPATCTNTKTGEVGELIDVRDGNTYIVKKLSDTRCWMAQNLRIVNKTISSLDSDVTDSYTIPASSAPWSDSKVDTNKVHYAGNESYGAYYSWYTATARTNSSLTSSTKYPATASGSICPKGWKLPTSGSNGEFQVLTSKNNTSWITDNGVNGFWLGSNIVNAPDAAFFPAGGYVNGGSVNNTSTNGYYWSSTSSNSVDTYNLSLSYSGINPSNNDRRYLGMSVRCVAKQSKD